MAAGAAVGVAGATGRRVAAGRRYRAAFSLPEAPGARFVEADDGVRLYVEEDGDPSAPIVVLFAHGFTARLEEFELQREALRDRARLVFYDQRGHGRSSWGDVRHATIEQTGRDLGAVLDSLGPDVRVVLVGHSMGGMSIMALLDERPELIGERVVGAGLIATAAAPDETDPLARLMRPLTRSHLLPGYLRLVRRASPALESVRGRDTRSGRRMTRRLLFGAGDATPYWMDRVQAMLEETPLTISAAFFPTFVDHDNSGALPAMGRIPVAVIVGSDDQLTPLPSSRRIAEAIGPSADLVVVPGAGHSVNVTRPNEVNGALQRLLDRATGIVTTPSG